MDTQPKQPDPFGHTPYLALPTVVLFAVTIGVGIFLHFQDDAKHAIQPSVQPSVPTVSTDSPRPTYLFPNCVVLEDEVDFVIIQCDKTKS